MINADQLFEDAGYTKMIDQTNYISFFNSKKQTEIDYDLENEIINIGTDTGEIVFNNRIYKSTDLTMLELYAIMEKAKELRFSNDN